MPNALSILRAYNGSMRSIGNVFLVAPDIERWLTKLPGSGSRFLALICQTQGARLVMAGRCSLLRTAALVILFGGGSSCQVRAQTTGSGSETNSQESSQSEGVPGLETVQEQSTASATGLVLDRNGAVLAGVRVQFIAPGDTLPRVAISDSKGFFAIVGLPSGAYQVVIHAEGVAPFVSSTLTISKGEQRELPIVVSQLPTQKTTVDVNATLDEIAQEQVHEEEQQRILGLLPNFYTSYIWKAAPLSAKLKFKLAFRTVTDPFAFVVVAGVAGVEQEHKTFPGYGEGFEGYAKRYGGAYADTVSGRMLGSAIFPSLLHQDPRYFYKGSGTTRSRLLYALVSTVICRGDDGQLEPNYSHVLGSFTAAGLSNVYRSPRDRRASLTIRNGFIITGGLAASNVLREFFSRKLTPDVPAFASGKP